jgi:universal stress protein A
MTPRPARPSLVDRLRPAQIVQRHAAAAAKKLPPPRKIPRPSIVRIVALGDVGFWHSFRLQRVVRAQLVSRRRTGRSIVSVKRILVPVDFSRHADAAFAYARELASPLGASVELLHVVEDPLAAGVWSSEVYTAEIAGLQVNLVRDAEQQLREYAAAHDRSIATTVRSGPVAREIVAFAADQSFDLIVMGTHGRTGVAHVVLGSVAERVVRLAPCPVLTLRAAAAS